MRKVDTETASRRTIVGRLGLAALLAGMGNLLAGNPVEAQDYPTRIIRIVVPLTAGGPTDAKARLIAPKLHERFGQPVIIENKPGAGAVIGTEFVARAQADGHTLLMGTPSLTINDGIGKKLPYDRKKDFVPVALVGSGPLVMTVPPNLPPKTVAEFVAYTKANAGKASYASVGHGTISHLTTEYFKSLSGADLTNIPYSGTGPAMLAIMAGDVQVIFDATTTVVPQVTGGKVRGLAVTTLKRSPLLPDVPTLAESGYPGFDIPFWAGLFAPAGTPKEVVEKLNREVRAILATAEMRTQLANLGTEPGELTAEQFAAYVDDQAARYKAAATAANIQASE